MDRADMILARRSFLSGIIAAAAAPVVIRTQGLIMPIKPQLVAEPSWPVEPFLTDRHSWSMDLNEAALENALVDIKSFQESAGQVLFVEPTHMIVDPGWRRLVFA